MFKIVATIVLSLNGQPAGEPIRMVNRITFENIEACKAALSSEAVKASVGRLDEYVSSREKEGVTHVITTSCEPTPDDGTI